jgi:hypothetical protein
MGLGTMVSFGFHGNWSQKICMNLHFLIKRIASARKFKKARDGV